MLYVFRLPIWRYGRLKGSLLRRMSCCYIEFVGVPISRGFQLLLSLLSKPRKYHDSKIASTGLAAVGGPHVSNFLLERYFSDQAFDRPTFRKHNEAAPSNTIAPYAKIFISIELG